MSKTPSRQPRWQRRAEDRPQEICAAALDVFAEKGFAAARLDEIARGRPGFAFFPERGQRFYVPFRKLMSFYAPVRWQTNANGGRAGATMISRTRFS